MGYVFHYGKTASQIKARFEYQEEQEQRQAQTDEKSTKTLVARVASLPYSVAPVAWSVHQQENILHLKNEDLLLSDGDSNNHPPLFLVLREMPKKNYRILSVII